MTQALLWTSHRHRFEWWTSIFFLFMSDDQVAYQDFIFFPIWPLHVIQNKEKYINVDKLFLCCFFLPGIVSKFFEMSWVCKVLINHQWSIHAWSTPTPFRNYIIDCTFFMSVHRLGLLVVSFLRLHFFFFCQKEFHSVSTVGLYQK